MAGSMANSTALAAVSIDFDLFAHLKAFGGRARFANPDSPVLGKTTN
jgi:hypothetical protein